MPRIMGVMIPDNKRIETALTHIYGIGPNLSNQILEILKIDPGLKAGHLSVQDVLRIQNLISQNYKIEGELRQEMQQNIRLLKDIGTYRGSRHAKRLPVRGQRTRTNSRTVRGNVRRTVGSGRRRAEKT